MKTYHIHRDILGADYQCLIRFLGVWAKTCQLISHGEPRGLSCREALSRLVELGGETKEVSEWHGTTLEHGATATLYSLPVTSESLEFLLTHVQSLFSWRWPQEPEDLCFEASDGTPLLISTAHEQYAQLSVIDDSCIDDTLEFVLTRAAQKGPCGLLVNVPAQSSSDSHNRGLTYVGIEGEGWPIDMPNMPPLSFGLAPEEAYVSSVSYWRSLMRVKGFEAARLLYLGEKPPCADFCHIGFDLGYYSNETDNLSLVLSELYLRTIPSLAEFRSQLNRYGLFPTFELATGFMQRFLSEPLLKDSYRGCLQDVSIVKIYCYYNNNQFSGLERVADLPY